MNTFESMQLPEPLDKALKQIGFEKPTKVQHKSMPTLLEGKDLMVCAETGSGKTAAYLIPLVKRLLEEPKSHGLVLAPTRELAQQIAEFLKQLLRYKNDLYIATLVGGQDIRKQFKALQRKPRVIVATPGRLIDHLKRNTAQIHKVNYLVLDEGDRMIDMGFAPQLEEILSFLETERQTSFFTATLDKKVRMLAGKYLKDPETLVINSSKPVSKIKQSVVRVEFKEKDECLLDEVVARKGSVIVFVKTKHRTDTINKYLSSFGIAADRIHGGRTQGQRNQAISAFKKGKTRVLCATDVVARGLDVPHVQHVINFDLPMQDEDYVHRVGRTARNGADGEAVSFVTSSELHDWNRLVKKYEIPDALIDVPPKKGKFGNRSKNGSGGGRGRRRNASSDDRRSSSSDDRRKSSPFGRKKSAGGRRSEGDSFESRESSPFRKKKKAFGKRKNDSNSSESPFRGKKKASGGRKSDGSSSSFPKKKKSFGAGGGSKSGGRFKSKNRSGGGGQRKSR
ncbi:MAG: ATP-dependent RNA helicase [Bdellovibrionaceae bacterium]|nr:ATP-dependent RNA helicase [Pseudobdellovibrionaceae bacterium]|tara:strand:+ start:281242 stop:282768 length:1527 start_codon:yes stop_codon:yes gene_type:complete